MAIAPPLQHTAVPDVCTVSENLYLDVANVCLLWRVCNVPVAVHFFLPAYLSMTQAYYIIPPKKNISMQKDTDSVSDNKPSKPPPPPTSG